MLFDTHAHLDYPEFEADFPAILSRAEAAGVTRIISIGTSLESSARAIALAEKYPAVYAAIGVHPNEAAESPDDVFTPLRQLAQHPRVVAIGEIGLDYYHLPSREHAANRESDSASKTLLTESPGQIEDSIRDGAEKSAQAIVFEQQLDLAVELGLNVIIHQRQSWADTLAILKPYSGKLRAVYHCFGEDFERAEEILSLGHLVSFTGIVTFKNAQIAQETAARVPSDRFMVETDCPYLAPVPHRGKRCEPAFVREVAEKVAELRGVTLEEIARQTSLTASEFFRFDR